MVCIQESHVGKAMREDLYKQGKIAAVTAEQYTDSEKRPAPVQPSAWIMT